MIRALWIAKTGLDAQQTSLDVITNNLANVSTNGYKRQRAVFQDLLYQTLRQPGAQSSQQSTIPSGLQIGTGVAPVATERVQIQGNLTQTGNPLDLAIQGEGFLAVLLPDGTTAYTRDGALQKDANGQLVSADGYPLQPAITIPSTATSITIGKDGVVTITQQGQTASTQVGTIQLSGFVNPGGLQSMGQNLFLETASSGTATPNTPGSNGIGTLNQAYLETSNVNVAEELVLMIQTQRAYEMNSKAITAADGMLQKLSTM
jgi:flagellar basal-body rod protein FlgG